MKKKKDATLPANYRGLTVLSIIRRLNAIMFYVPFFKKMSIIYHWNKNQMFYLRNSLDVAYPDSAATYTLFNFASVTFY